MSATITLLLVICSFVLALAIAVLIMRAFRESRSREAQGGLEEQPERPSGDGKPLRRPPVDSTAPGPVDSSSSVAKTAADSRHAGEDTAGYASPVTEAGTPPIAPQAVAAPGEIPAEPSVLSQESAGEPGVPPRPADDQPRARPETVIEPAIPVASGEKVPPESDELRKVVNPAAPSGGGGASEPPPVEKPDSVAAVPITVAPRDITVSTPVATPEPSKESPKRLRSPRQYRPVVRAPAAPRETPQDSEERVARERALPIEVRLIFEKAGFCNISLLPRRAPALPGEIAVSGSGDPPELISLQDDWYQDVILPDMGTLLRRGIEWEGYLADGRIVRWSLSGRELFVLCRHGDLNGFVSTPRLILGEQHVVLCTEERLQDVRRAVEQTGSPEPHVLDTTTGIPQGWIGLRGVVPRTPVAASQQGEILDVLRPLANIEVVLEGGIRLERQTWLRGYPPRIRLRGDVEAIHNVVIDGREATLGPDGGYAAPGWDLPGQHQVWCASASRSYSIREGVEDWEVWDAYTWSMGDFSADGERAHPAICGVLVLPPRLGPEPAGRHGVVVPASNSILIGAEPGQIYACDVRCDVRAQTCIGFPWFNPVWAIPADTLRCDKRIARVLLIGDLRTAGGQESPRHANTIQRPQCAGREHARRIKAWTSVILAAGRKGLATEPPGTEVASLWQVYKQHARAIQRRMR